MEIETTSARPARLDVALALALLALKESFVSTGTLMSGGATPLAVASAALLTLPLAWRRTAPLTVAAVIAVVIVADDVAAGWQAAVISFDCSIIAAYSAAANARQPRAIGALAALLAANLVDALGAPGNRAGDLALGLVVFSLVPWIVGQALRRERRRSTELRQLASELAAEREQRARDAVSAERGRIARELHDIVGHSISLISVQADAAARLLRHDPVRAREPLETIQESSRGALAEMRQLVGLLREKNEQPLLRPQPGLADLTRLLDEANGAGLPVTLEISGERRPLPPTPDLAAYRIVQEGLTNVRKHAGPARAWVRIRYDEDCLHVEVQDDGRLTERVGGGGHGLIGIRERVNLLGGELHAGPTTRGGFLLHARIPLTPPPR